MSEKRYIVELSEDERSMLTGLTKSEKRIAAQKRTRAQVLLKVDQGPDGPAWTDGQAADAFNTHFKTVVAIRRRLVEEGFERAIERKKQDRPSRAITIDDAAEKELVTIAQSDTPDGRARWTLHLLADRLVELRVVEAVSHETVRKALKKTRSNLTARRAG